MKKHSPILPVSGLSDDLQALLKDLPYFTPEETFGNIGRGDPNPAKFDDATNRRVGLHRDTWKLEIEADSEHPRPDCLLMNPLLEKNGNAIDYAQLQKIAVNKRIAFPKLMTCLNLPEPLGMGMWVGVPLRDILMLAEPSILVRRVFFYGYHNDDIEQRFQASLSINRILEDPPGMPPIILCYEVNGMELTPARGAPVRIIAPESYGFRSVKWLQKIVVTHDHRANDTYAEWNKGKGHWDWGNDTEASMKLVARFHKPPDSINAGQPIPLTGIAQVGIHGLSAVEVAVVPWEKEQKDFFKLTPENALSWKAQLYEDADWQLATLLEPSEEYTHHHMRPELKGRIWGMDTNSGLPSVWPMPFTLCNWAIVLNSLPAGKYTLICRAVNRHGVAQPLPLPSPKSGMSAIQKHTIVVE
ncbi:molybdopterin-dependent oxidoreductase [Rubellicoccus peritrichatus]|uniref:Molybdopterin-dependent oxidoreductase n=1 Tax=Rubellicoccus peritrichatus TaxID=3080537 RepID=A0AAQ3LF39_9BACT|nr:molybdopterin-dependent oxidoreductase [Puniceicoccus sp. CR14]WOO42760.1 molybdopterin-dependent oxidoreductase [Puniceicoccus sp. CR14]